jgi:GNAT superfamily N-acetyltransferase
MTMLETDGGRDTRSWLRFARFEDVPGVLRLVERAIERGCRGHYGPAERHAVYASYAQSAFVDVLGGFETFVAETPDGAMTAFAQLDASAGRLRALFVDAGAQGRGVGRAMLAHVIERASARGNARVHGAMSLNAVPFYERSGFRRCAGRDQLWTQGIAIKVVPMERSAAPLG